MAYLAPGASFGTPTPGMNGSSDRPAIVFDFDGVLPPFKYVSPEREFIENPSSVILEKRMLYKKDSMH